ncbi:translocation/assembly module TamB [Neisseria sp. ZJ106]|uniref:Translocation/assembly module TamB n=1 Tax=Neisseria lisongii TaxID=2912188 RepID=A0ABY7RIH8_9NEIS|nr:translocation/assembly module TamB domain-containing protein [Neisseria lisongii]MCF7520933.1 translocation/assembly module TamB [Neisseria lisongii]WCL71263.1 translocation/assembly module TamB [Neisseria lisongii]
MSKTHNPPPAAARPSEKPAKPRSKARFWKRAAWTLSAVFLLLTGFVGWLSATESGLRFGLYRLPSWFGVKISSQTLQGTLLKGFSGKDWLIETQGADVKISDFHFAWQPSELSRPSLHITELRAGDIAVVAKPLPVKEEEPASGLPESIDLPITVFADRIETGKISVGKNFEQQTVYIEKVKAAYHYDRREHRLDIVSLQTPWSESAGAAVVGLKPPFALNTAIYTKGELEGQTIHGTTRLWGSLQDVHTDILLDGDDVHLSAKSELHPFAATLNETVSEILIKGRNLNPAAFLETLPTANLTFDATVVPAFSDGLALEGSIDLLNSKAGFADRQAIPVRSLLGSFTVNHQGVVNIDESEITLLQQGRITLGGTLDTVNNQLNLALNLAGVKTADVVQQDYALTLNGRVAASGETDSPDVRWNINSGTADSEGLLSVVTDRKAGQRTLKLDHAKILPQNGGELTAAGYLELFQNQALKLDIASRRFNPAKIDRNLPEGSVSGTVALSGALAGPLFAGKMNFAPSTLNGVALSGKADVAYEKQHLSRALADIRLGSNLIQTDGSFGKKGDRLNLNIQAPDLSRFGFGLSGALNAKGHLSGDFSDGLKNLETDLAGNVRNLKAASLLEMQHLDFRLKGSPDIHRPLAVNINGERILFSGDQTTRIDHINLNAEGSGAKHRLKGSGNMMLADKPYRLQLDAEGGVNADLNQWKGSVGVLDIGGAFNLKLQNRINLEAGAERVVMSPAHFAAMGGSLNLQSFAWDKKNGIATKGSAANLHLAELHQFYQPPVEHNLVLGGDWDMAYGQNARGYLNLVRQGGDVILPDYRQPLGLSDLGLKTRFQNGRIDALFNGNTRFGRVEGNLGISQQFGSDITQAPVSGKITATVPDLSTLKIFLPPAAQGLSGSFQTTAAIGGRIGAPTVNAGINGQTNYGYADGTLTVGQGQDFASAPLGGKIRLNVDNLEVFRNFLPVGQTVKGRLSALVGLGGRIDDPQLNGTLNGENLYYRNQEQGLILDNGVLRSHLQGRRWIIDSLKFHRGGSAELKGSVGLTGSDPDVDVDIVLDKYRTLSRPNRRLVLSGKAKVLYTVQNGVSLIGGLKTDYGMFGMQKSSMPTLDDDVVVLGEAPKAKNTATPIRMDLDFDLNDNIRFVGEGLNVTLGGKLKLTSRPGEDIQGIGTVKVIKGRYKAYGQDLDITKGTVSFVGPLGDPNLNIRAARRLSPVGAGVEVLGNLAAPRITLVADEPMSEKDKLSWLILNRASSGSDGDEAALSAAAGALLAGQVNDRLGLVDDFGFTSKRSRNAQTGELNPAEQVLTVGKQLTNELYLGYEYGIASAEQTVKLIYQLTRSLQAVARVGSKSWGGELKYTVRFDRLFKNGKDDSQPQAAAGNHSQKEP